VAVLKPCSFWTSFEFVVPCLKGWKGTTRLKDPNFNPSSRWALAFSPSQFGSCAQALQAKLSLNGTLSHLFPGQVAHGSCDCCTFNLAAVALFFHIPLDLVLTGDSAA